MPPTTIFVRPPGVPEAAPAAVETHDLSRLFAGQAALSGISIRIEPGATVLVEGTNGAGKTTLLRIFATALRPSYGSVLIDGVDAAAAPERVRPRLAFLGHASALYEDLTAIENLKFAAIMLGVPPADRTGRVRSALERVEMLPAAGSRVQAMSAGMRRRIALARLLLGHPRLVLLDEPLTALDQAALGLVDGLIADWAGSGATVVIASHLADRLQAPIHGAVALVAGQVSALSGTGISAAPGGAAVGAQPAAVPAQ